MLADFRLDLPLEHHGCDRQIDVDRDAVIFDPDLTGDLDAVGFEAEGQILSFPGLLKITDIVLKLCLERLNETLEPYLYLMRCELHPDAEAEQAELLILDELDRLRSEPVGEDELRRAHNQCCTQVLLDFETTLDQAVQLGLMETLGGFEYWQGYLERIRSVSAQDVLEAARQFLAPERAAVGVSVRSNGGLS